MEIVFKTQTATCKDIIEHLWFCDGQFNPRLSSYVNIQEYAIKLHEFSTTFEAWHLKSLIGLVAAYINDEKAKIAFISNVSVADTFQGKGVAKKLLSNCIHFASQKKFTSVLLEVNSLNREAIDLYKKNGFVVVSDHGQIIKMSAAL